MSDPVPEPERAAGRAVRVGLAPTSPDPDVTAVVVRRDLSNDDAAATVDGRPTMMHLEWPGQDREDGPGDVALVAGGDQPTRAAVRIGPARRDPRTGVRRREVIVDGWRFEVDVESEARAALRDRARRAGSEAGAGGPTQVHAIIPGVVVAVSVAPGDAVTAGQQLLVVEAMKMQNELRAPRDGVVGRIVVGERQTIEVGDLLLVLE